MKARLWLPAVLVVVTAACAGGAPGPYTPTDADRSAVNAVGERYVAAFNAQDAAGMAQLVAEDYERVNSDGTATRGRAEFQAFEAKQLEAFQQAGAKPVVALADPTYQRWLSATQVVSGGGYTVSGGAPGGPTRGAYMNYLVKGADGAWQVKNQLVAPEVPPAAPPAAAAPTAK